MKKRFFCFLLILCMLFSMSALPAHAAKSGRCGDNLTWTLNNSGTLTISGTGAMTDYSKSSSAPWYSSRSSVKAVIIQNGVTSIGAYAFYNCSNLTSIIIPDSITSIGNRAFYYCTSLTSVTLPDRITSIENSAFYYCTSLTSVTLPDSITSIGNSAFYYCTSLTSVTLPDSVTSIGNSAFSDCRSLTSITIGDSVTSIGEYAFSACSSLASVTIGDNVTSIEIYAFYNCSSLTAIEVSESNQEYSSENGVLFNKNKTTLITYPGGKKGSYTVPDGVTSIGFFAFCDCNSLTSITIPNSVTSIGAFALSACNSLTSITIPDSVTSIERYAFSSCSRLTRITIPDSVTSIGEYAFSDCGSLTAIDVNENNQNYSSENGVLFNKSKTTLFICPVRKTGDYTVPYGVTSILDKAFSDCSSLTSIIIPDSVTSIGAWAFYRCRSLISITIPDSVTSIGEWMFDSCENLTSIIIPDSVTSIGRYAFEFCYCLTDVYYKGTAEQWSGISVASGNEYLTYAARHYLPAVKLIQDGVDFTVIPENIEESHNIVFAAYKAGRLIELQEREYIGLAEEFTVGSDYDTVKVMLWKNLGGMKPLTSGKGLKK